MKITESQLRQIIRESLNELSPEYLSNAAEKARNAARNTLKGKLNKKWMKNKIGQANEFEYTAQKMKDDETHKYYQQRMDNIRNEVLSKLKEGIYITCFFQDRYEREGYDIRNVAIQTKEEAAYYYAENKHKPGKMVKIKGPFNSYEEALAWINEKKLSKYHRFEWDSQEIAPQNPEAQEFYLNDNDIEEPQQECPIYNAFKK